MNELERRSHDTNGTESYQQYGSYLSRQAAFDALADHHHILFNHHHALLDQFHRVQNAPHGQERNEAQHVYEQMRQEHHRLVQEHQDMLAHLSKE